MQEEKSMTQAHATESELYALAREVCNGGPVARRHLVQTDLGNGFSRRIREKVLDRYDQNNPEPEHRFWKSSTNATGGKSYVLSE